jgi:hypothetical protein
MCSGVALDSVENCDPRRDEKIRRVGRLLRRFRDAETYYEYLLGKITRSW